MNDHSPLLLCSVCGKPVRGTDYNLIYHEIVHTDWSCSGRVINRLAIPCSYRLRWVASGMTLGAALTIIGLALYGHLRIAWGW